MVPDSSSIQARCSVMARSAGSNWSAINVWTRALFFDRSHARARAYIDRARSALAERQREAEELLQGGAAAFRPHLFVVDQGKTGTRKTHRGGVVCIAARGTEKPACFG